MDRYIEQLVEDMRAAATKVPAPGELWDTADMDNPNEVEDLAYVEQYLHGTPQKLAKIVGIEKVALPPQDKLSDAQAATLYREMTGLLNAFHFFPDFPKLVPVDIRYRILRNAWDNEYVFIGAGQSHIEFCHYEPAECPFPQQYCDCRKWAEENKESPGDVSGEMDDDALPF